MTHPKLRALFAAAAIALATLTPAQTFPTKPVRIIVPFPPGGGTDVVSRLLGQKLGETWGRPIVVDNRPGGNALIGADAAAKSPPDGYTLLAITLTHAINASLFPNAPYDLRRDLAAISVLGTVPPVVVVNPSSPARTMADLAEMARRRSLNGASSSNGSPAHLGLELFRRATGAGANLVHVPYRGGAPAVTDLVAGNVDFGMPNLPECIGQIRAGRLRALAVTGDARHPFLPDVPTAKEAGLPDLAITNWTAVLTNAAVPALIRAKIERDTLAVMRDPDVVRRASEAGFEPLGWPADRSARFIAEEVERWARLAAEAGIRAD